MTLQPVTGGFVRHRDRMVQESVIEDLENTLIACRWKAGTTNRPVVDPNAPGAAVAVTTTEAQVLRLAGQADDGSPLQVQVIDYFPEADSTVDGSPRRTPPNTLAVDSGVAGESALMEMGSSMREQPYLFTMALYARTDAVALALLNDLRDRYLGRIVGDDFVSLYDYNASGFDQTTPPVTRMEVDAFRYAKNSNEVATPSDVHLYFAELQLTDFVDS